MRKHTAIRQTGAALSKVQGQAGDCGFPGQQLWWATVIGFEAAGEVFTYLQAVEQDKGLPKLIVTDLNMPGITGYELLKALATMHRCYQHIHVIVLFTSSRSGDRAKCLSAGAKQYITKPNTVDGFDCVARQLVNCLLDK